MYDERFDSDEYYGPDYEPDIELDAGWMPDPTMMDRLIQLKWRVKFTLTTLYWNIRYRMKLKRDLPF